MQCHADGERINTGLAVGAQVDSIAQLRSHGSNALEALQSEPARPGRREGCLKTLDLHTLHQGLLEAKSDQVASGIVRPYDKRRPD